MRPIGANSGLGFATAVELASRRAEVHLLCRDSEKCASASEKIKSMTQNENIHCHSCDTSDFNSVRRVAEELKRTLPRLDVLVNNAGGMPKYRQDTAGGNELIIATALGGTMLLSQLLLPLLRQSSDNGSISEKWTGGRIINVSSGGAYVVRARTDELNLTTVPYDGALFYSIAKRAQVELTVEWARRLNAQHAAHPDFPLVAVHSMHPGWASTEGLKTAMSDFHNKHESTLRSPEEGSDTIVFLSCDSSAGPKQCAAGGDFWFDREIVRRDLPFASTSISDEERSRLWDNAVSLVSSGSKTDAENWPS
jgi:dehydrogenase/reductase SDR family protein 12